MKVIVCGGRHYCDQERVFKELDTIHKHGGKPISMVIQGGAAGADRLGRFWAENRGVHCAAVHALWDAYGKAAGIFRNDAMLSLKPDLVIAFPGGRGTADMVGRAKLAGIKVIEIQ